MTKEELYAHPGWQWCTFEGARKQVLLLGLQSTFREKLEWLEEAETLSLRLRANRELRSNDNYRQRGEKCVVRDRLSVIGNQWSSNVKGSGENSRS